MWHHPNRGAGEVTDSTGCSAATKPRAEDAPQALQPQEHHDQEMWHAPVPWCFTPKFLGWPLEGKCGAGDSPEAPGRAGCFAEQGQSNRALVSAGCLEKPHGLTTSLVPSSSRGVALHVPVLQMRKFRNVLEIQCWRSLQGQVVLPSSLPPAASPHGAASTCPHQEHSCKALESLESPKHNKK